jgi:hypothetical protein
MRLGTVDIFLSSVFNEHSQNKRLAKVRLTKKLKATLKPRERFRGFLVVHFAANVSLFHQYRSEV